MSRNWTVCEERGRTRRGAPSAARRPAAIAAATALCCVAVLSCGGKNTTPNLIKPVTASVVIDPVPGGAAAPYIFVENPQSFGDLVTVDVVLHAVSPTTFDAYNLEFSYDPTLVQPELHDEGGAITPFPTSTAVAGAQCNDPNAICPPVTGVQTTNPLCGVSATGGTFLFGAEINTGQGCVGTTVSQDTKLLTIGLQAETTGTSIIQIAAPGAASCAILDNVSSVGAGCYGRITLTATR